MLNHGVTFNLDSAKVCSPAKFEKHFSYVISYPKIYGLLFGLYSMYFYLTFLFHWQLYFTNKFYRIKLDNIHHTIE